MKAGSTFSTAHIGFISLEGSKAGPDRGTVYYQCASHSALMIVLTDRIRIIKDATVVWRRMNSEEVVISGVLHGTGFEALGMKHCV